MKLSREEHTMMEKDEILRSLELLDDCLDYYGWE